MWLLIFMATIGIIASIAVAIVAYRNREILFPKQERTA
jgi:hypothetical protein